MGTEQDFGILHFWMFPSLAEICGWRVALCVRPSWVGAPHPSLLEGGIRSSFWTMVFLRNQTNQIQKLTNPLSILCFPCVTQWTSGASLWTTYHWGQWLEVFSKGQSDILFVLLSMSRVYTTIFKMIVFVLMNKIWNCWQWLLISYTVLVITYFRG